MDSEDRLRILLIDDDKDLLDLLQYNFQKEGFHVRTVSKARRALSVAVAFLPELIVLDVSMPDGNGIDICREIRRVESLRDTFIFFLTARSAHSSKEKALEIGADDFIEKLGGLRALTNKVTAVLKNNYIIKKRVRGLASAELVVDKRAQTVYLEDRAMAVTDPEFEILFFLMQNPNRIVSTKNLIKIIWGSDIFVLDGSVKNYVESLQRKIGTKFIETVSSGQYRFVHTGR